MTGFDNLVRKAIEMKKAPITQTVAQPITISNAIPVLSPIAIRHGPERVLKGQGEGVNISEYSVSLNQG
jgi:hypothetical protein